MKHQSQLNRIMREQGLLCFNCGSFTRDGLCGECQLESDELTQSVSISLNATATANEIKAKALTVLMAAKRNDIITWGREKAFDWLKEQAINRGIAPELQENFVNGVAALYLQSLS